MMDVLCGNDEYTVKDGENAAQPLAFSHGIQ